MKNRVELDRGLNPRYLGLNQVEDLALNPLEPTNIYQHRASFVLSSQVADCVCDEERTDGIYQTRRDSVYRMT